MYDRIIYVHADPKIVAKYGTIRTLQLQMDERVYVAT